MRRLTAAGTGSSTRLSSEPLVGRTHPNGAQQRVIPPSPPQESVLKPGDWTEQWLRGRAPGRTACAEIPALSLASSDRMRTSDLDPPPFSHLQSGGDESEVFVRDKGVSSRKEFRVVFGT